MTSRGKAETQALIKNVEDQMNRLVQQLADLDQYKCALMSSSLYLFYLFHF